MNKYSSKKEGGHDLNDCPWKYRTEEELGGISYYSNDLKFTYPASGYSKDLARTRNETAKMIENLRKGLLIVKHNFDKIPSS